MQVAIVIKPDDTIETVEYKGYDTLHDAVDGFIEHIKDVPIPGVGTASFYCNEEFLLKDEVGPANAIASGIYGDIVFGNVVVDMLLPGGDSKGFDYVAENGELQVCEAYVVLDVLKRFVEKNKDVLAEVHQAYDNVKPDIKMRFYKAGDTGVVEVDTDYGDR